MESVVKVQEQLPAVKEWTVKELMSRRDKVLAVMSGLMVNEIHYGVIPGCGKKPTLLKPGAEMLLMTFRLAVKPIEITDLSTEGVVRYRVILGAYTPTGDLAGTGVGECSSAEDKYQWRAALCKEEFDATPPDQKREKWKKDWVNSRPVYKTVQQIKTNAADIANTILKMGKKRSMIDLTLTTLGVSDKFRQDIDDIPEELLQTVIEAESREIKQEAGEVSLDKVMAGKVKPESEKTKVDTGLPPEGENTASVPASPAEASEKDKQEQIIAWGMEMTGQDSAEAEKLFIKWTKYVRKDKSVDPGLANPFDLKGKRLEVTLSRAQKDFYVWKEAQNG